MNLTWSISGTIRAAPSWFSQQIGIFDCHVGSFVEWWSQYPKGTLRRLDPKAFLRPCFFSLSEDGLSYVSTSHFFEALFCIIMELPTFWMPNSILMSTFDFFWMSIVHLPSVWTWPWSPWSWDAKAWKSCCGNPFGRCGLGGFWSHGGSHRLP